MKQDLWLVVLGFGVGLLLAAILPLKTNIQPAPSTFRPPVIRRDFGMVTNLEPITISSGFVCTPPADPYSLICHGTDLIDFRAEPPGL